MNRPADISKAEAQLMMSQLIDGELSPDDANALHAYLDSHPEEAAWMESLDTIREANGALIAAFDRDVAISSIQEAIDSEKHAQSPHRNVLSFSSFVRPLAAAAAIAVVGAVTWLGIRPNTPSVAAPAVVEFVETDIPNASTFVLSDQESGWTVVWVESDSAPQS